jgi:hypothetical protein
MKTFPTTQEEFNQQVENAMREDFGYEPSIEEKQKWMLKLLELTNKVKETS